MVVYTGGNDYSIVFCDSWDVSGAMGSPPEKEISNTPNANHPYKVLIPYMYSFLFLVSNRGLGRS